ncbi:conserved Plasmodium protein, unknown function [Plasmodium berghei]|uniref:Uncharacterized protein n=2 Tax=Plasmodium berghei TaxID=5821 RepID=A0A509AQG6_PLABA|nr:conserved protein, unknown function [Plasmodium berghei ANKA]CXI77510.1 conserved Plasmodium protein, unknown function [Plasmodium berghei]SCM25058.1 conserved Plasmodium protein, unknown function [Plasmodium berghei]SCN27249.1 conserved Plasmodium protein, unknown function [Plasmodium berghei]SCO61840.1 conserved Plasmodium protein, unknown function [Plasmodium berghei]SCO63675.1 conserved Plasmodium protein, unknown function [Plasmodium berghei]|eukprot:XP_034422885.1 conserved protein, unknown function [Plasmodium berghei ANKA]
MNNVVLKNQFIYYLKNKKNIIISRKFHKNVINIICKNENNYNSLKFNNILNCGVYMKNNNPKFNYQICINNYTDFEKKTKQHFYSTYKPTPENNKTNAINEANQINSFANLPNEYKENKEIDYKNVDSFANKNSNEHKFNIEENEEIKKEKKFSKIKIIGYTFILVFGTYVSYKVYKNNFNLSKAEESILKDFFSIIYTYEEKESVKNSKFITCLNENLRKQLAMYFLQLDADKKSGFIINDALIFLSELNINEDNEIVKKFIQNGNGKNSELKKYSGCSLQQFGELIENLILENKTKNHNNVLPNNDLNNLLENNSKRYYINIIQNYLNIFINAIKMSNLYLYYQNNKKNSQNEDTLNNLEALILDKLTKYNDKYVDKKNLSLDYILSKEEIEILRKNCIPNKKDEEKELLLIEKKNNEDKIKRLLDLQKKKKLTETEIKRLQDLKGNLKKVKYAIKKEQIKRYFN